MLLGRGQCCHLFVFRAVSALQGPQSHPLYLALAHSFQLSQEEQYAITMPKATEADQENTGRDWKNAVNGFHTLL